MVTGAYVYIATSLDAFIARKNGNIDWLSEVEVADEDYGYQEFMNSMDVLVMGRNTYEKVIAFDDWPYSGKNVVVLSHRTLNISHNHQQRIEVKSCSPIELRSWASSEGYKKIYVDGGYTISSFLNDGLVKEITISTIPILLGEGIPLFSEIKNEIQLCHLKTKTYASGVVKTTYRVIYP